MNRSPSFLERLGNALAFALVLAIIAFGAFSIYNILQGSADIISFGGSEELRITPTVLIRQPTLTPIAGLDPPVEPTGTPLFQQPTPAPPSPTGQPEIALVLPPTATLAPPTVAPSITVPPTLPPPTPTLLPTATPFPTATPLPTETPLPTPIPPTATPAFAFRIAAAGPDFGRGCTGYYIFGYVRDGAGNPLPGLRVRVSNEYGLQIPPATTKVEPPGWYDVLISEERVRWYVQVVDASNSALSPTVEVLNTGAYVPGAEACWHQVDFVRN